MNYDPPLAMPVLMYNKMYMFTVGCMPTIFVEGIFATYPFLPLDSVDFEIRRNLSNLFYIVFSISLVDGI
jgi:hypothetical protein